MTASIKALILIVSLCASVTLAASEVDIEMQVNDLSSPIFVSGCKPLPGMPWAERYRGVVLIYSAGRGWLVGIRDDMTIEAFGGSGSEYLKPFSWDFMGGVWSINASGKYLDFLNAGKFNYREKLVLENEIHSLGPCGPTGD